MTTKDNRHTRTPRRFAALGIATAAVVLSAGLTMVAASAASARSGADDGGHRHQAGSSGGVEKQGRCSDGRARYNLEVEREHGGYQVDFEVRSVSTGATWRVKLFHDGNRFYNQVRSANGQGRIEVRRQRPNTAGQDTFRAQARSLGSGEVCSVSIVRS
jgi:hypothetical protein